MCVCKQTQSNISSACQSAALSVNLLFSAQRGCADISMTWPSMKGVISGMAMILHTESFWSVQWHLHSQVMVKTHTEVGFKTWQLKANAGDGHRKHIHEPIVAGSSNRTLHQFPAHTLYFSRIVFMQHVWLLSKIVAKTDSQIYGLIPVQLINWLFKSQ